MVLFPLVDFHQPKAGSYIKNRKEKKERQKHHENGLISEGKVVERSLLSPI